MVDRSSWDQSFVDPDLAQRQPTSSTLMQPSGIIVDERLSTSGLLRCQQAAAWVAAGSNAVIQQHRQHMAKIPSNSSAFYQNGGVESRRLAAVLERTCPPVEVGTSMSSGNVCRASSNPSLPSNCCATPNDSSSSSSSSSGELCQFSSSLSGTLAKSPTSVDVVECCALKQSTSSAQLLDVDSTSTTTAVCRSSSSPNCFDEAFRNPSPSSVADDGRLCRLPNDDGTGTTLTTSTTSTVLRTPKVVVEGTMSSLPAPSSSYSVVASFLPAWDAERLELVYRRLAASGFYAGRMSVDEAARRLARWPVGSFLLRDSSDSRYLFSVSVQTCRGTTSVRMAYRSGLFRLDCHPDQEHLMPTFDCALRLLRHYVGLCRRVAPTGSGSGSSSPPAVPSAAVSGTMSSTGGHGYVLLETTGRRDTPVLLRTPYRERPSTLTHLCRVRVNRAVVGSGRQTTSGVAAPSAVDRLQLLPSLKSYLKDYPYDI